MVLGGAWGCPVCWMMLGLGNHVFPDFFLTSSHPPSRRTCCRASYTAPSHPITTLQSSTAYTALYSVVYYTTLYSYTAYTLYSTIQSPSERVW